MPKPSRKRKDEIKEVEVEKVQSRISLESILDEVVKKAVAQARLRSAAARDRAARITELSEELAREIRALREESPVPPAPRKGPRRR